MLVELFATLLWSTLTGLFILGTVITGERDNTTNR